MKVVGVDGTAGGWVAVVLDDGRFGGAHVVRPVEASFAEFGDADVVAIDVPIGFGPRRADAAARGYLRGAASTVFSTPSHAVLEQPFAPGLGVSKQAHSLGRRILHVTTLARNDPRIREVHPEASFRAMNGGRALGFPKKTAGGALERMQLLRRHAVEPTPLGDAASTPLDDVLDAAAAAWSANRIAVGEARSLPEPPEELEGYPTAIWY